MKSKIDDEEEKCEICGKRILPSDYYFIDNDDADMFKDSAITYIARKVAKEIDECKGCTDGGYIDGMNEDYKRKFHCDTGFDALNQTTVEEFLEEYGLDEWLEDIMNELQCPHCGYGERYYSDDIGSGPFKRDDNLYTRKQIRKFWGDPTPIISKGPLILIF